MEACGIVIRWRDGEERGGVAGLRRGGGGGGKGGGG